MRFSATTLTASLLGSVIVVMLAIPMMLTWERPPMESTQLGFRGTGMDQITNPRKAAKIKAANPLPVPDDPVDNDGVLVKDQPDVYQNVQVLGDVDTAQFTRLMNAISTWVAPQEGDNAGCAYCHNLENMASDELYTKVVARRMLQMTRALNTQWQPHTLQTGVTCYTCHRGQPVPANIWARDDGPAQAGGYAASRMNQNLAAASVGLTSLPYFPQETFLMGNPKVVVQSVAALPGKPIGSMAATEQTYGLMMYVSKALGVNCTFCHNSRAFANWGEGRQQRVTAWHGLRMVGDINTTYLEPLKDVFPANRKGPQGDVMKVECKTCHNGVNKPLHGFSMAKAYPELSVPNPK